MQDRTRPARLVSADWLRQYPDPAATPATFDQWCDGLRALSAKEPDRYGPDAIANCGADCWRDFFDMGYSPVDAWDEDGTYD